jgi:uncharacterized protein YndB with AHSA1/START domain
MSAGPRKPGDEQDEQEPAAGELGAVSEPGTFRIERVLPGPIERIWAYLTDSEKRQTWLASGPMELRVGGQVALRFRFSELSAEKTPRDRNDECVVNGRVTRCDPPRLLSYTWGDGPGASQVTFQLSPHGEEVLLVITHQRLADRGTMVNAASAWHTHVGILLDQLDGQVARPFWATKIEMETEFEKRLAT